MTHIVGERAWTEAEDLRLRDLWRERLSKRDIALTLTDEFGRQISRNAVLGRLYRLGLSKPRTGKWSERGVGLGAATGIDGRVIPPPKTCQWPQGEPGKAGFRFCGKGGVVPGKPYCAAHCAVAYRKPRDGAGQDSGEDAA